MTEFKIERGVPVPDKNTGRSQKYPWHHMTPGDSVFFPGRTCRVARKGSAKSDRKVLTPYSAKRAIEGSTWVARDVTEHGIAGVRIWRLT